MKPFENLVPIIKTGFLAVLNHCIDFLKISIKLFSDFKRDYLKPKFYLHYANKSPWPIHIVFIESCFNYENMFVTVLDCCFEF
jgi:hypothetical protein